MSGGHVQRRDPYRDGGLTGGTGLSFPDSPRTDRSLAGTCFIMLSSSRVLFAVMLLSLAACHPEFKVGSFTTNEALYRAGLAEFQRGKWDNAITAFDKLTAGLFGRGAWLLTPVAPDVPVRLESIEVR